MSPGSGSFPRVFVLIIASQHHPYVLLVCSRSSVGTIAAHCLFTGTLDKLTDERELAAALTEVLLRDNVVFDESAATSSSSLPILPTSCPQVKATQAG